MFVYFYTHPPKMSLSFYFCILFLFIYSIKFCKSCNINCQLNSLREIESLMTFTWNFKLENIVPLKIKFEMNLYNLNKKGGF